MRDAVRADGGDDPVIRSPLGVAKGSVTGQHVDFQLRLTAAGLGDRIRFNPRMATDHHNQVSTHALLRKRALSGQGLARCRHRHGARL
ncbi:hypothetical protein [Streptomyces sp. NPDC059753]|uniref:hypothetical protein n=1 Tax=Streptomyces sp. NPDC059753 TaxID=3346933 RepID=UPI0036555989